MYVDCAHIYHIGHCVPSCFWPGCYYISLAGINGFTIPASKHPSDLHTTIPGIHSTPPPTVVQQLDSGSIGAALARLIMGHAMFANNFYTTSSHEIVLTHTNMLNNSLNNDVPSTWAYTSEHAQ